MTPPPIRKKLIEVALPLEAINIASAREKSIRHGHPSTLHLWWARRPLAAARAVIFAQMVDDPSSYVEELKDVPQLRRKAEAVLRSRHTRWKEATATLAKARAAGVAAPEPGPEPELDDILAEAARNDLFKIIEELVKWENTTNETVLQTAREAIWDSWRRTCRDYAGHPRARELFDRHKLPAFHDPFAGGGALPLEAQRLGLEAYASDLNPVAVLINKAMIEIPPKFASRPPVNPESRRHQPDPMAARSAPEQPNTAAESRVQGQLGTKTWCGAQGLADDVRYYGKWMRDEAEKRIGHLYPKIEITPEMVRERPDLEKLMGQKLTVIAWLWARTVKSPNPAFREVDVPLASTFMLFDKPGKEAWVEPVIENGNYSFAVQIGKPKNSDAVNQGTTAGKRAAFRCLMSGVPITYDHIRSEGKAGRLNARLMAIVAEGERGRIFLSPTADHEAAASKAKPEWRPQVSLPDNPRDFKTPNYGLMTYGDLFTPRQLTTLTTFSNLVGEAANVIRKDSLTAGFLNDGKSLCDGGVGTHAYAEAIATYLAFNVSKFTDLNNSLVTWKLDRACPVHLFARQAIPMVWDYPEANPFSESSGSWVSVLWHLLSSTTEVCLPALGSGHSAEQADAQSSNRSLDKIVSTDPPYYDNIGYADLSDFFYVWLRRSLKEIYPSLFATLSVPKSDELVATPYRHGGKERAEEFFLHGMTSAMHRLAEQSHVAFPVTIYYAFKQAESQINSGTASTGWETFLDAVIRAGFGVGGTWPVRTEMKARQIAMGTNALASSIVLVCRPRAIDAPTATRREFVTALQRELPDALRHLQAGNIAPVDLAQAAIGPGMAVFTRYAKVLDASGKELRVREALILINETLDTALAEQEGDFDSDTRWALAWFEQYAFAEGEYGVAEMLSKAKNTSISGLADSGVLVSAHGKVRLLRPDELPTDWDPFNDARLTVWEMVHHLIRVLDTGETPAAELVAKLGVRAETARELAYRLYMVAERKKRAAEALAYNGLVQSWPDLLKLAQEQAANQPNGPLTPQQTEFL